VSVAHSNNGAVERFHRTLRQCGTTGEHAWS